MNTIDREIDRILTLLRNKIREQGFTQLQVQEALHWGRSYISQLLTKQKSLRVEQVLKILHVIDISPADFYAELYHFAPGEGPDYPEAGAGAPYNSSTISDPRFSRLERHHRAIHDLRALTRAMVQVMRDKDLIDTEELERALRVQNMSLAAESLNDPDEDDFP